MNVTNAPAISRVVSRQSGDRQSPPAFVRRVRLIFHQPTLRKSHRHKQAVIVRRQRAFQIRRRTIRAVPLPSGQQPSAAGRARKVTVVPEKTPSSPANPSAVNVPPLLSSGISPYPAEFVKAKRAVTNKSESTDATAAHSKSPRGQSAPSISQANTPYPGSGSAVKVTREPA